MSPAAQIVDVLFDLLGNEKSLLGEKEERVFKVSKR